MSETNLRPDDFEPLRVKWKDRGYWDEKTNNLRWEKGILEQASIRHFEFGGIEHVWLPVPDDVE